eukprot:snap_masked-scaffold_7-processed-gene-17.21-mRNA-1 protein AED:1.00 eAED:1.00 QI:0/0/0/0/1/1/2/0/94
MGRKKRATKGQSCSEGSNLNFYFSQYSGIRTIQKKGGGLTFIFKKASSGNHISRKQVQEFIFPKKNSRIYISRKVKCARLKIYVQEQITFLTHL